MSTKYWFMTICFLVMGVFLTGCKPGEQEQVVQAVIPETATIAATPTSAPTSTPTCTPTHTPMPTSTPTSTPTCTPTHTPMPTSTPTFTPTPTYTSTYTPTPTRTPMPTDTPPPLDCLGASYLVDVTVPDNTHFEKGESFVKTWLVRNTGDCDWPEDTLLIFVGGNQMGTSDSVAVGALATGEEMEVSVAMTAPNDDGRFQGTWQLADGSENYFGTQLVVIIGVGAEPIAAPAKGTQVCQVSGEDIPILASAEHVHCQPQDAHSDVIYSTGVSPEQVYQFYWDYMPAYGWEFDSDRYESDKQFTSEPTSIFRKNSNKVLVGAFIHNGRTWVNIYMNW